LPDRPVSASQAVNAVNWASFIVPPYSIGGPPDAAHQSCRMADLLDAVRIAAAPASD